MKKGTKNTGYSTPRSLVRLDTKTKNDFLRNVQAGMTISSSANAVGISSSAIEGWLRAGKAAIELNPDKDLWEETDIGYEYVKFLCDFEQAEAIASNRLSRLVVRAGAQDWRAAVAWLKMRFPEQYSDRAVVKKEVEKELESFFLYLENRLPGEIFECIVEAASQWEKARGYDPTVLRELLNNGDR